MPKDEVVSNTVAFVLVSGLQVVVEVVLSVVGATNICSQFSASLKHEGGPDLQPMQVWSSKVHAEWMKQLKRKCV